MSVLSVTLNKKHIKSIYYTYVNIQISKLKKIPLLFDNSLLNNHGMTKTTIELLQNEHSNYHCALG
jgi:hypothetical protein